MGVRAVDANLGIDAVAVRSVRPPKPKGALICSYYGATGHAANEATVIFLRANGAAFAAVRAGVAAARRVELVTGIGTAAFAYAIGPEHYLEVLTGGELVECYAAVPPARLERLARAAVRALA